MTDDNRPLWLVPAEVAGDDALPETCDDLVIGAGVVGLTTAVLLARAGRSVCVVEARYVGAGSTGHSSAKVSLLQGTRLSTLLENHSRDVVQAYVNMNRAGF
ncbi:MAG: FAD-dependent oxidoreductase, partial [Aeromicrobium sp.]